ncbi:uncharacterized protein FIESC28_00842 [Fusarium coffeatum]|uniref:Nephrocystin 3-like N-terminal domain-containing protein n=1 Tax=Fusarium coffeatum TaxID=231269 RepID=A0A366SBK7_9HYPO|nr:uncharacterized protein FIESC28_00842 [Fusarium coffeatum]RBR26342.1 hypothetical protein FIESC28_00842 [Fusarium coffeatum]
MLSKGTQRTEDRWQKLEDTQNFNTGRGNQFPRATFNGPVHIQSSLRDCSPYSYPADASKERDHSQDLSWIQEAVDAFYSRTLPIGLSQKVESTVPKKEVVESMSFLNCKAFRNWLLHRSGVLFCLTSHMVREKDMEIPFALGASLMEHISESSGEGAQNVYLNCFSQPDELLSSKAELPQGPSQEQKCDMVDTADYFMVDESYGSTYQGPPHKISAGIKGSMNNIRILGIIYQHIFVKSPRRKRALDDYAMSLQAGSALEFIAYIRQTGMPSITHLLPLLERLIKSTPKRIDIIIDNVNYLSGSVRTNLVTALEQLWSSTSQTRTLLCGATSLAESGDVRAIPIINDTTELNGNRKSRQPLMAQPPGSGPIRSINPSALPTVDYFGYEANTTLVADWFYHGRRGGGYIRHESFTRSVLYQFLQQDSELFDGYFKQHYREVIRRQPDNPHWALETLETILSQICRGGRRIFCVIDAMDEAEDVHILELLQDIVRPGTCSRAKFIVLSRHNVNVERHLHSVPSLIVEKENENDIRQLVDLGVEALRTSIHSLNFEGACRTSANVPREEEVYQRIREAIFRKSQGTVLWVKLVLDRLQQEAAELGKATLDDLERMVDQIPEELVELYKLILQDLIGGRSPEVIENTRKALMWISAAAEIGDVTLESLWEALALIKTDDEGESLDDIWEREMPIQTYDELWRKLYTMCGPFIELYTPGLSAEESQKHHRLPTSVVQLMHQSVRDFFGDRNASYPLHFLPTESLSLVRSQLSRYLSIIKRESMEQNAGQPQDPEQVIDRLDRQRLLRQALKSAKILGQSFQKQDLMGIRYRVPVTGSEEHLLVCAVVNYDAILLALKLGVKGGRE